MHPSYIYFANDRLSAAELSAARLDGHLVELGEGYIPADAIETGALRAASLGVLLGSTLAATHVSAAWVHGALDEPPPRHTVQRAVPHRLHHIINRRLVYRDGALESADLVLIAGVLVTRRRRTLGDLARQVVLDPSASDPLVAEALHRMAAEPGAPRDAIIHLAGQGALPGKPAALTLLRRLETDAAGC